MKEKINQFISLSLLLLVVSCAPLIDTPPVPSNYSPQNTTPVEPVNTTNETAPPPPPPQPILLPVDNLGVYVLDMNGSSVITLNGKSMLVNANQDTTNMIKIMKNLGIKNLDYLLLTNELDKNIIGASPIVLRMKPNHLVHSGIPSTSGYYFQYTLLFDNETIVPTDTTFKFGESVVSLIAPYDDGEPLTNDNSIVVKLSYGNFNVLLASDCGADCESRISNVKTNVLVSNGACDSLSYIFIRDSSPEVVVFTGTPCQETFDRVNQLGIPILKTSVDGDVVFNSDGISYTYKNLKSR